MNTFSMGEAFSVGWAKFALRPWYLIGVVLLFGLLFGILSSNAVAAALGYILYGGYLAFILKHYRGETVVLDDLFTIDARWIYLAFGALIKWLLIFLGLLVFVIPGVYLWLRFSFVELLIIDKGLKPMEALRASTAMTKGYKWRLFGFALLGFLCMLVGLVFLVVGIIPASLVVTFAVVHVYHQLSVKEMSVQPA